MSPAAARELLEREQHAGRERLARGRVVADRQHLARAAEEHLLVRDEPGSRTEWIGTSPPSRAAVAFAVPDGASSFVAWCSSTISARVEDADGLARRSASSAPRRSRSSARRRPAGRRAPRRPRRCPSRSCRRRTARRPRARAGRSRRRRRARVKSTIASASAATSTSVVARRLERRAEHRADLAAARR